MKSRLPRALVVEDEPSWQQILHENLTDAGMQVDTASSQEAAQELLHANAYRLALVDLSLESDDPHNEDGLRVLETVRRTNPTCAAILLTGFATVELAVRVMKEYNALSCLRKEAFQRSELRELVRQALAAPPDGAMDAHGAAHVQVDRWDDDASNQSAAVQALVVEDDAGWRGILEELLSDVGFRVRLCASFGEAFGLLRREHFHLAVMDLGLSGGKTPELEGYRLLQTAREQGVPALVVSGVSAPVEIERAYEQGGIFAYVEKQSFDRRAFLRLAGEALRAGRESSGLGELTAREYEVLRFIGQGRTNKEIAVSLMISENTVKRHIKAVFRKLEIHTRAAAAAKLAGLSSEDSAEH